MLLFLAVPFKVKAETATTPVSISVQYGQTEARTILNMINEMRTSSTDAWYWKQDDTTKTYCTNLQPLQYDYDNWINKLPTVQKLPFEGEEEDAMPF
mgnify:CR=1 FL=1